MWAVLEAGGHKHGNSRDSVSVEATIQPGKVKRQRDDVTGTRRFAESTERDTRPSEMEADVTDGPREWGWACAAAVGMRFHQILPLSPLSERMVWAQETDFRSIPGSPASHMENHFREMS